MNDGSIQPPHFRDAAIVGRRLPAARRDNWIAPGPLLLLLATPVCAFHSATSRILSKGPRFPFFCSVSKTQLRVSGFQNSVVTKQDAAARQTDQGPSKSKSLFQSSSESAGSFISPPARRSCVTRLNTRCTMGNWVMVLLGAVWRSSAHTGR